jgi:hypothetical protein
MEPSMAHRVKVFFHLPFFFLEKGESGSFGVSSGRDFQFEILRILVLTTFMGKEE